MLFCIVFTLQSYGKSAGKKNAKAESIKMEYVDSGEDLIKYRDLLSASLRGGVFDKNKSNLGNLDKEPEYNAKEPLYGKIVTGIGWQKAIPMVLDKSDKSSAEYDIIRIDSNDNGDLTDDEPVPISATGERQKPYEAYFDIMVEHSDKNQYKRKVYMSLSSMVNNVVYFTYKIVSYNQGEINIDGETYNAALYDGDSDGVYNYSSAIFLIWKRGETVSRDNEIKASLIISFKNKLYSLTFNAPGDEIKWGHYSGAAGTFKYELDYGKLSAKFEYLELFYQPTSSIITFKRPDTAEIRLPAGAYYVTNSVISLEDGADKKMNVTIYRYKAFSVNDNKTTELKFGQPFNMAVDIPQNKAKYSGGEEIEFKESIIGASGEIYKLTSLKGKEEAERLKFTFEDKNGNKITEAKTRFG